METFTSVSVRAFGGSSLWLLDQTFIPHAGRRTGYKCLDVSSKKIKIINTNKLYCHSSIFKNNLIFIFIKINNVIVIHMRKNLKAPFLSVLTGIKSI